MSAPHALGLPTYVISDNKGRYFHFWDRATYGEPQFGDGAGAKHYAELAGCLSRVRALRRVGYDVAYHSAKGTP